MTRSFPGMAAAAGLELRQGPADRTTSGVPWRATEIPERMQFASEFEWISRRAPAC